MTRARAARAALRWPTAWCARRAMRRAKPASASASSTGLIDEGTLETLVLPPEPVATAPDPDFLAPDFTPAQRAAADALRETVANGGYAVTLARRRHRLGQDRGLFRSGGGDDPAQAADSDPDAGDRAHRAIPRPLRRAVRHAAGGMAFANCRRASVRGPGAQWRTARSRSWSARARRCFCPTPISASSSSMRSTTRPTSRRTACTTTPATWRWCAGTSRKSRSCSPRRRRRSRPRSMRGAGATGTSRCPSASAASICRRSRRSI